MGYSNHGIFGPKKGFPHIYFDRGFWRVNPVPPTRSTIKRDRWGAAHVFVAKKNVEDGCVEKWLDNHGRHKATTCSAPAVCHAGRDGECNHEGCPQLRDCEPARSGRSCPLAEFDYD